MGQRLACVVVALVSAMSLAGCTDLQRQLEYANLDEVAVDATGKQLWELEFGEREIEQVKKKLWRTKFQSLYCMRDNADRQLSGPGDLSREQTWLRADNIEVLVKRALLPVIKMREEEAKREYRHGRLPVPVAYPYNDRLPRMASQPSQGARHLERASRTGASRTGAS